MRLGCNILFGREIWKNTKKLLRYRMMVSSIQQIRWIYHDDAYYVPKIDPNLPITRAIIEKTNGSAAEFLAKFYKENNANEGIKYLSMLLNSTTFIPNEKTLLQAAKIVALFNTFGTNKSADVEYLGRKLRDLSQNMRNIFLRTSVEILLDCCQGKWDKINLLNKIPCNEDFFEILAANALAFGQIDVMRDLCATIKPKEKFFMSENGLFWELFMKKIQLPNGDDGKLMKILMDQLISLQRPIVKDEWERINLAIEKYGKWKITKTKVSQLTLECSVCGRKLQPQKTLNNQQFSKLKSEFKELLIKGLKNRTVANDIEMEFSTLLKTLKINIRNLDTTKRPLVVDGLNLTFGKSSTMVADYFHNAILFLIKRGFYPILIVTKAEFPEYNEEFKQRGVRYFNINKGFKGDQRFQRRFSHEDDLFILNSAFLLGPNTYVLSNDQFLVYDCGSATKFSLEISNIFKKWRETRIIRFLDLRYQDKLKIKIPSNYLTHTQGDEKNGYHIIGKSPNVLCTSFTLEHIYCVKTA